MTEQNVFGQKIGWNRTGVSQPTFDAAKKIYDLADGLTHDEFVTAMKLALEDVEANLILKSQPVQQSDNQDYKT
ncbi:MAG: hypothetical protein R2796_07115 [Chitinophagaceae bacterium]